MSDLPKPISQEVKPSRQRLPSARGNWPRPGFRNAALCLPDSPGVVLRSWLVGSSPRVQTGTWALTIHRGQLPVLRPLCHLPCLFAHLILTSLASAP